MLHISYTVCAQAYSSPPSNKTYFTLPAYNWILQVTEIHQEVT